jgi:hypothetical protein
LREGFTLLVQTTSTQLEDEQATIAVRAGTGELLGAMVEALENAGLENLQTVQGIQVAAQGNN